MDSQVRMLALVMAGGRGSRLFPLTAHRAKPAVPFAGRYRIIDFVLSNLANSGVRATYVLTQYRSQSLAEHVQRAWGGRPGHDSFVTVVPAQMQLGEAWYRGTADSVFQNFDLIDEFHPDVVLVFGADHIYKMDVGPMIDGHLARGAVATVACLPVPVAEASQVGVMQVDGDGRVVAFVEKPEKDPPTLPNDPTRVLASMGNYVFNPKALGEVLSADSQRESHHDFGRDILPTLIDTGRVFAYDFSTNRVRGMVEGELPYWRDVGTLDAYYQANMDLKNVVPSLNLYNWEWPIHSAMYPDPPAKLVFDEANRRGIAVQSIIGGGSIIAGGFVKDSVLGRNVFVDEGAEVRESVLFDNVHVGKGARVWRGIIDKNVRVTPGDHVGHDLARDYLRHTMSEGGITVVRKARETMTTRARDY